MPYERLDPAMNQLVLLHHQLQGLAVSLPPEQLAGGDPQESALRQELASDVFKLLEDTEAAVDSGEPEEVVVALANAAG
ncbi:hypothetical protein ACFYPC_33800 [Streptomyces sp. NPDC005808]|uniref:hypothetical protein n=1 Tax=Streptomyces sp. NPDC005808 TaxID=3364734 RepID=UPI0036984FB5